MALQINRTVRGLALNYWRIAGIEFHRVAGGTEGKKGRAHIRLEGFISSEHAAASEAEALDAVIFSPAIDEPLSYLAAYATIKNQPEWATATDC